MTKLIATAQHPVLVNETIVEVLTAATAVLSGFIVLLTLTV
jgi:hypothetical protein